MARLSAANNAEAVLTNVVSESDTSITVDNTSVFPVAPYRLTIGDEITEVISVDSNTLTVIRGLEGTNIRSHTPGTKVQNRMTAGTFKELVSADELDEVDRKIDEHKADYTQQMGTANLQTTDKTLKGAINEVFTLGNNVKSDTVDALLSVDDSLPITSNNSWQDVINAIGQISAGILREIKPGDNFIYNDSVEISHRGQTYTKYKSVKVFNEGQYRVSFSLRSTGNFYDAIGRVHINGVAVGIERFTRSLSYISFVEDFELNEGDVVELWINSSSTNTIHANNFGLGIDVPLTEKLL